MAQIQSASAGKPSKNGTIKSLVKTVASLEGVTKGLVDKVSQMSQPVYQPHRTPSNLFGIVRGEFGKDSRPAGFSREDRVDHDQQA